MNDTMAPEFSRILDVEALGETARRLSLEADEDERAALARRFDLVSIAALTADLSVERIKGGDLIRVRGRVSAKITQSCVVTGEPVEEYVDETVDERFGPPEDAQGEVAIFLEEEDPPEPVIDGQIDIGELVAQYVGVAINPYPRAPGAEVPRQYRENDATPSGPAKNPFAALAAFKKKGD